MTPLHSRKSLSFLMCVGRKENEQRRCQAFYEKNKPFKKQSFRCGLCHLNGGQAKSNWEFLRGPEQRKTLLLFCCLDSKGWVRLEVSLCETHRSVGIRRSGHVWNISASRLERCVDPRATEISNEPTPFATGYWGEAVRVQFDLDFLLSRKKKRLI